MKILVVNDRGGFFGGVEQNVADCAAGLSANGHEVFLAFGSENGTRHAAAYRGLFGAARQCYELGGGEEATTFKNIVLETQPDCVYLHKVPAIKPFLEACRDAGIRAVRMIHDHDLCCPTGYKYFRHSGKLCHHKAGWRCWADLGFLEKTQDGPLPVRYTSIQAKIREMNANFELDALVVASTYMKEELLTNGCSEDRVHLLAPVVKLSLGCDPLPVPSKPQILYVGQLLRGKGVDLLLDALSKVSVPFDANIIGAGNAEVGLKSQAESLGLSDRVRFLGWAPNDELNAHYNAARVVVVPSRWPEPFGMVGLEAMMHGRPVVAFNVGGIPDWLDHEVTGLLAPEQDSVAFAAALDRMLTEHDTAISMGKAAFDRVSNVFGFGPYMEKLESTLAG